MSIPAAPQISRIPLNPERKPSSINHFVLTVEKVRLEVHLGWTADERKTVQPIEVDIAIRFENAPLACETDELDHTLCYQKIVNALLSLTQNNSFRLIESMSQIFFQEVRKLLPPQTGLWIKVHKLLPPIKEVKGGATFSFGDWNPGSHPWSSSV